MNIKPQLAEAVDNLPMGADLIMEPKYDGIRILAEVTNEGVKLWTRNGNDKSEHCPEICQELSTLPAGTWLDGEVVGNTWGETQSATTGGSGYVWYVVFDLLMLDGQDARPLAFRQRRELLEGLFENLPKERVLLTPQVAATDFYHSLLVRMGYEGIVIKRLDAPYASGERGRGWSKIKGEQTMEAVITGYKPGNGSNAGLIGSLCISQYRDGKLVQRGHVGGGFTHARRVWLTEHLDELIANKQVVEVLINGYMPSGAPRNPRFLRLRDDKVASDCVWDD